MPTLHSSLADYVQKDIKAASDKVQQALAPAMPPDEFYESLIASHKILMDFHNAARLVRRCAFSGGVTVQIDGQSFTLSLSISATDKWPIRLFPDFPLPITPENKLYSPLKMMFDVSRRWEMLGETFKMIAEHCDLTCLPVLFPWLRNVMLECSFITKPQQFMDTYNYGVDSQGAMTIVGRHLQKLIKPAGLPKTMPSVTRQINDVCKSGRELYGQYHMLEATMGETRGPFRQVIIQHERIPLPSSLRAELNDIVSSELEQ